MKAPCLHFLALILLAAMPGVAQNAPVRANPALPEAGAPEQNENASGSDMRAEAELQTGTRLTRAGQFEEAIPHLLAARGNIGREYAASFDLALCYVGTHRFKEAIAILEDLRKDNHKHADVENLLAQAYIGDGRRLAAWDSLERASALSPHNEKLYLYVADACMDQHDYPLGLKVVELGLANLPESAGLHYERGAFLSLLDEFDQAKADFAEVGRLAPRSEISYLAAANEQLHSGNPEAAVRVAREGAGPGYQNPTLLAILGEALIRSGVRPGETSFSEAEAALAKAVAERPWDAHAQATLGRLYVLASRPAEAIVHLEKARELDPNNPSIYASLAKAYQRKGDHEQAQAALSVLAALNQAQAQQIGSAPGDRKAGYLSREPTKANSPNAH